ncbi:hypothetical protein BC830DRAFT_6866 [Chytriomyces sp. MP71]|nr:hypothetical protein BC830DRAFT_6866 [Chytriomyces sp. MP71]
MHGNQKALKEHQSFALRCLGADLLQLIVNASVKSRKLDRFMVKRLALCGINRYNFDSYSLATDSLMEAISIHHWNSLERLSLKGAFVTDEGIFHLQTCRSLEFLDLSGCRVTDHVFQVFPTFSRLYSLNLSRTKISSAGLKQFVSSGSVPPLEYLNLSFCENVTSSDTFLDLTQLTTNWLRVLSLQGCQLKCPLSVPINPRVATAALEVLDLSRIQSLTDVDFQTLSMFVNLLDLDLTGSGSPPAVLQPTPSAATATTLNPRHLHATELDEESPGPGMRLLVTRLGATLHRLSLPHKQSRSINAITRILLPAYGMVALTSLDFTGFMWLTDSGILHLRAAHELRVLCLAGTQITEEGFRAAFSGAGSDGRVLCPKLIEVNVDRSAIGEGIFVALRDHALIETLGLSETPVTDDGIGKLMPECRFRFTLRKLNLARTEVTEVGVVKALSGYVNLGSLNLERTGVSSLAAVVFGLEAGARNSGLHLNGSFLSGGIRWAPILSETAVTAGLHNEGDEIE